MEKINKEIIEFNSKYYDYLKDNSNNIFDNQSMNMLHHMWRVVIQYGLSDRIRDICSMMTNMQNNDGSWGNSNDDIHHKFGKTVVNVHRMLWSLEMMPNANVEEKKIIIESIRNAVPFIQQNHDTDIYPNFSYNHGLIDRLHYLIQTEYYIAKYNKLYDLCDQRQAEILLGCYAKDSQWLVDNQAKDGGWHEPDRVRLRDGVTADAIRGLILNDNYLETLNKGIDFLINNQNPHLGYWSGGIFDKVSDVLKALMNSLAVIKDIDKINTIQQSIILGINWLWQNLDKLEKLEESDYDLLTVTIDYQKIILEKKLPTYV